MQLYPLPVPPGPWHVVGHDYLIHLRMSNGFDSVLIVVDRLTLVAHYLPCTESETRVEDACLFVEKFTYCMDCPECLLVTVTRNTPTASGIRFEDALERG
jgi:hypothetical protein